MPVFNRNVIGISYKPVYKHCPIKYVLYKVL